MAISTLQYRIDGSNRRIHVTMWLVQQDSRGKQVTSPLLNALLEQSRKTGIEPSTIEPYWLEYAGSAVTAGALEIWLKKAADECDLTATPLAA